MQLPKPSHSGYRDLIHDIESGKIKIPQFQRDFVWSLAKSAALIDSIVKGYPIGTFIFWNTKEQLRSLRDIGNINLNPPPEGDSISYILDGQQRLTSLFAALKGVTIGKNNYANIFIDLEADESEPIVITDIDNRDATTYISLGELLTASFPRLVEFPKEYYTKLSDYKDRIYGYDFPIVAVQDVKIDIATEIFTRINVGGKSLSVFEIMVAKTYDETQDFDLSIKFNEHIERLQQINYDTIPSILPLQLISLILKGDCKKQTILNLDKNDFIDKWNMCITAIESAAEYFRDTYRIPVSKLLPYNALLVTFGYFFYKNKDKPNGEIKSLLEDFFWRCSLAGRYSSSTESKLTQDLHKIDDILDGKNPEYDWNIDTSPEFIRKNGDFSTNRAFIKSILCLLAYAQPKSFSDEAIVRISNDWLKQANSKNYHHFFPKSFLKKEGIMDDKANNIVNITFVDDFLNKRRIGAKPPSEYMRKFKEENSNLLETMATHLIDSEENSPIWTNDYEGFLQNRAKKISQELEKRIIRFDGEVQTQSIIENDTDPELI